MIQVAVVVVVAVAAALQALSGIGFALVAGPLLILALGQADGVRLAVALSLLLNATILAGTFRHARWGDAARLFVPAALLVWPAALITGRLRGGWVLAFAGVAVLAGVALIVSGRRAHWVDRPAGAVAAGGASGVLNVLAGVSGPPVALLVAHRGWEPRVATATLQAYSLPLNAVTLTVLGPPTGRPAHFAGAILALLAGAAVAWPFAHRIGPGTVRAIALAMATVGALSLLARAAT
ncbi:TSUP family transporter [Paractinoplanes rhizophilus]|uniref:Probable membrane transporter protein n=1 Tax=Paractinoplanes rhizophilus TaxID=1416877 RepID=A0ABW2HH06_9ACTN|nr:TSUP family transporter [Actinoplanes sp.]